MTAQKMTYYFFDSDSSFLRELYIPCEPSDPTSHNDTWNFNSRVVFGVVPIYIFIHLNIPQSPILSEANQPENG